MEALEAGDLTIEVADDASAALVCTWRGKSTERNPKETLAPYFDKLLDAAASDKLPLEMHFEQLEHFNSSTITALIRLIQSARSRGVTLVMVYDAELKWQRLSFDALRVFDKGDQLFSLRAA